MDALRKAAEQALEAMEADYTGWPTSDVAAKWRSVKASLRAALAEQEQEPDAWMHKFRLKTGGKRYEQADIADRLDPDDGYEFVGKRPLYTHPPRREWQGLTDEEIEVLNELRLTRQQFARAIEAALKERNHG